MEFNENYMFYISQTFDKFSKISLMEVFVLIDGLICAFTFFKEYTILKLSEKSIKNPILLKAAKTQLLKNYNDIYILSSMDRYLIYLIIYFIECIIKTFLNFTPFNLNAHVYFNPKIFLYIICLPFFQNIICNLNKKAIIRYKEDKEIFLKYNLAKLTISFMENLHEDIDKIPNYHIFIIYKNISVLYLYNTIKIYLFITLLYFLKSKQNLYYYYKAIKLAYFYETGFLFNMIPINTAVYTANLVIKNKRYNELSKIEICNAFYILIKNKFKMNEKSFYVNFIIIILKICSFWSIVSLLKIMYTELLIENCGSFYNFLYSFFGLIYCKDSLNTLAKKKFIKKLNLLVIIYFLITFNVNDIIITLFLILYKNIYYLLEEIYFFKTNKKNIRVVLSEYYKSKSTNKVKMNEYVKID